MLPLTTATMEAVCQWKQKRDVRQSNIIAQAKFTEQVETVRKRDGHNVEVEYHHTVEW